MGRIERGLVAMGHVVDVMRGMGIIKRERPERAGGVHKQCVFL